MKNASCGGGGGGAVCANPSAAVNPAKAITHNIDTLDGLCFIGL
jgi:hypothetical protein